MSLEGTVIKSTGSWYKVEVEGQRYIDARLKGKIRLEGLKSTNPIAVGDKVRLELDNEEYLISQILPRRNYIIRRSINLSKQTQIIAANLDQLFLVICLKEPQTFMGFVDRFLVGAEAYRIPVKLIFNKIDLLQEKKEKEILEHWQHTYRLAGYEQILCSVVEGFGLDEIKKHMKGKISMFSGHSGVGKSSLINSLDSKLNLKVNEVSNSHLSGKHTTTFAEMFTMSFGAKIIDTPGIKGFGNVYMEKQHLSHYFPEMRARLNDCKYHDCLHINEPGCIIKDLVNNGKIPLSRYENYLSIYEEDETESYRKKGY